MNEIRGTSRAAAAFYLAIFIPILLIATDGVVIETKDGGGSLTPRLLITKDVNISTTTFQKTHVLFDKADATTAAELRFAEATGAGGNTVTFKAPDSIAADVVWTLPADNTTGFLKNTAGTLSWSSSASATLHSQEFTANGTFTVPSGVTEAWATCVGAGGGGGGSDGSAGGGGGGGGETKYRIRVTGLVPGNNIAITVGSGGAGGTNAFPFAGGNGGSSSFGATVAAAGGAGGFNGSGGTAGTGGNGGGTVAGGAGGTAGNAGANGIGHARGCGGGGGGGGTKAGGSAGDSAAGAAGGVGGGGGGGSSQDGAGGTGGTVFNGTAGSNYGGGGGGTASAAGATGGTGAGGIVIVEYVN